MIKLKSTAKRTKNLDYNKEFTIETLRANQNTIKQQEEQIKKINPNITNEQLQKQILNLVARDNAFNEIMGYLVTYYEFNLDPEEIKTYSERIKNVYKDAKEDFIQKMTENMLKKTLVFDDLASLWDIRTDDEETKQFLQNYYKQTNNPIRDILNNKDQFDNFKQMIQDEKITGQILQRFRKVTIKLPKKPEEQNKSEEPKNN